MTNQERLEEIERLVSMAEAFSKKWGRFVVVRAKDWEMVQKALAVQRNPQGFQQKVEDWELEFWARSGELSYADIGRNVGMSRQAVRYRLRKIRAQRTDHTWIKSPAGQSVEREAA